MCNLGLHPTHSDFSHIRVHDITRLKLWHPFVFFFSKRFVISDSATHWFLCLFPVLVLPLSPYSLLSSSFLAKKVAATAASPLPNWFFRSGCDFSANIETPSFLHQNTRKWHQMNPLTYRNKNPLTFVSKLTWKLIDLWSKNRSNPSLFIGEIWPAKPSNQPIACWQAHLGHWWPILSVIVGRHVAWRESQCLQCSGQLSIAFML